MLAQHSKVWNICSFYLHVCTTTSGQELGLMSPSRDQAWEQTTCLYPTRNPSIYIILSKYLPE